MGHKAKILVVDDSSSMRSFLAAVLNEDYQVITAENGTDAIILAQAVRPDIILLDVEMGGMSGYETCSQLKQAKVTASIPVIFVSACAQLEYRLKGYEAGGSDYIIKPF